MLHVLLDWGNIVIVVQEINKVSDCEKGSFIKMTNVYKVSHKTTFSVKNIASVLS